MELIRYDAMCRAIDAAYEVDEVKDIRDKARAMEVYAKQALNLEAERRCNAVRLRAERRVGQLLRETERAKGSPGNQYTGPVERSDQSTRTLTQMGISKQQSSDWQKLADVPDDDFERALSDEGNLPSCSGILHQHEEKSNNGKVIPVSDDALWLWGRLRDFEREDVLSRDISEFTETMTPEMWDDVLRLGPAVAGWLMRIGETNVRNSAFDGRDLSCRRA